MNQAMPSEKDISRLPRWARVALAARCARRVLPLAGLKQGSVQALRQALQWAEQLAHGLGSGDQGRKEQAASLTSAFGPAAPNSPAPTHAWIDAARAVAKAVEAAVSADSAAWTEAHAAEHEPEWRHDMKQRDAEDRAALGAAAAAVSAAAQAAVMFSPAPTPGPRRYPIAAIEAMRSDYDLLVQAAGAHKWTNDTRIPLGLFRPLWPDGPPDGWPEPDSDAENAELVLTLDVPEAVSDRDLLGLVAELVTRADGFHRAYGGHGLEVEEGNVDVEREALQPVPGGGQS